MMNKKNLLYAFVIGFFLLVLFSASEVLYTLNNDSTVLRRIVLQQAIKSAKDGNANGSLNYLLWAAKLRSFYQLKKYNKIFSPTDFDVYAGVLRNSNSNKSAYNDYIKSLDADKIFAGKDFDFLRIFYNLALIAKDKGNKTDVLPFLEIGLIMEPELSHIHVEVANYYLLEGDTVTASAILDKCMSLYDPYIHCQSFKSDIPIYTPLNTGHWKDGIDKQYE